MVSLFLISPTPAARKDEMLGFVDGRGPALGDREVFVGEAVLVLPVVFLSRFGG